MKDIEERYREREFKTKVDGSGEKRYNFVCYGYAEYIDVGDVYIYLFGGIVGVRKCFSGDIKKYGINENGRVRDLDDIDFVPGFWKHCYKIKSTDFDLSSI